MVTNYNPCNPNIKNIIHNNWYIIANSSDSGSLFTKKNIIGLRRLPNLRDTFNDATLRYSHEPNTITTQNNTICTRLGKCTYCPLMKRMREVKCNFTHKFHQPKDLPKHITCEINNVIYLIICTKCNMHHVGETSRFCLCGVLRRFQHCRGHITTGSWKGRGNQYIEFSRVVYCKLPTNGKQLPAFPLTAMTGIEPRPQGWEARVLPLCHRGPLKLVEHLGKRCMNTKGQSEKIDNKHLYHVISKIMDTTTDICSPQC